MENNENIENNNSQNEVKSNKNSEFNNKVSEANSSGQFTFKSNKKNVIDYETNKMGVLKIMDELERKYAIKKEDEEKKEEKKEVDREKLLGIDLEQLGSLKDKARRLIDHLNSFENNENAVKMLEKKVDEIKVLEDDIDNIVFNISKVDKIIYGPEETKVIFKKDK